MGAGQNDQGLVEHARQYDQAGPGRRQFAITEQGRNEPGRQRRSLAPPADEFGTSRDYATLSRASRA